MRQAWLVWTGVAVVVIGFVSAAVWSPVSVPDALVGTGVGLLVLELLNRVR